MCYRKMISCVLVTMISMTLLMSGCKTDGSKDAVSSKTGQNKELTVAVFDRGAVPVAEGDYEQNRWTKWIKEQSGIDVKWVPIPRNEARERFSTLIAGGDAPNIIVDYDVQYIASLVNQGVLQPVEEYINQYSTQYKKYLEENSELKPYVTFGDKMYAFTSKRSVDTIANHAMWIRQDWLDKLHLKAPTTDEELLEVARKFKTEDPDGNGVNDTYGLSMLNWKEIFPSMYFASSLWYAEDGKMKYGNTLDRYADSLAFVKKIYEEKLIDPEFITDKNDSIQKQSWITGKSGILTNQWTETLNRELMKNDPKARPVPLEAVSTKYGKNGLWQESLVNRYVVFSNTMKNPEIGVKFIDWMIDKGWHTLMFGQEGVNYRDMNGVPQVIDAEKNKKELNYALDYPIVNQWMLKPEWIPTMAAQDELSQQLAKQREQSLNVAMKNKFRRDLPYEPPMPEVSKLMTEFAPQRDDIRIKVILSGDKYTPEMGIQEIRQEWNRLGGEEVEKLVTEWYQKNKDSFSAEK